VSGGDNPGAAVRPPRLYLGALVVGIVLDYFLPLASSLAPSVRALGVVPAGAGLALALWSFRRFSAAGTNVPTVQPTMAVVTDGPYRFTRNPIYVGMTLLYLGLALMASSPWALVLLVPVLLVMELGVIRREER